MKLKQVDGTISNTELLMPSGFEHLTNMSEKIKKKMKRKDTRYKIQIKKPPWS